MEDRNDAVTDATDVVELSRGPAPGSVIADKYRVESTLGFGGMGIVLAARHLQLDERVAIEKILRDDVRLEPEIIERFIREAQSAARLKSEHVARVDDVGTLPDGKPFMVMELLDGLDLGRLLQDSGQVARVIAVDIVLQVCDALAEAHSHGIIHRDIKPTNLFVTTRRDGSPLVKVLDFGISKAASSDLSLTQTSSMLGTPTYMSPEQMRSARTADARSDIWSLGTVLYELVEGMPPFEASSFAELCVAVATEHPRDMVKAPELQPVLARALTKNPDDRYPTIAELADALVPFAPDPQRAARQVNRIFRLLGKQAPHPGARDSTPALVHTPARDSASRISQHALAGGAPLSGAMASAAPTIARARNRRRPLWFIAAAVLLLAIGAGTVLLFLAGQSREQPKTVRMSETASPPVARGTATIAKHGDGSGDPPSLAGSGAVAAGSATSVGSAEPVGSAASLDAAGNAGSAAVQHVTMVPPHRLPAHPPIHRAAPHRPPVTPPQVNSEPPPPPAPKCDPFANPKGCPK